MTKRQVLFNATFSFVSDRDGSGETQLTQNGSNETEPSWTNDDQIVYARRYLADDGRRQR